MSPLQVAALLLGLAALGGATMVALRLRGRPLPPLGLALGHGGVAASGLAYLAYQAYSAGIPQLAQIALGIFVLAALGGAFVFVTFHLKNRPLPIPIILGHGLIALTGYALLVTAILSG
jgi:hypothetical protein